MNLRKASARLDGGIRDVFENLTHYVDSGVREPVPSSVRRHLRAGSAATAERHRDQALAAAPSTAVRQLLQRRLTKQTR
jgi:hypothetical protein